MTWASGAATDTGLLRARNEDRYWADPERGVFVVADGVGGNAAGDVAAQTAVDVIRSSRLDDEESVRDAVARANNRIHEMAEADPGLRGMACVLTVAAVAGDDIVIGHVGDSRLYLIWRGSIRKLTADHSPVGEDEDAGALTEREAMFHPRRNEVFRDVGSRRRSADEQDFVEVRRCRLHRDGSVLLCSDGLTDHLTAAQVRGIVERYDGDPARVAAELVDAANQAGGKDNITALFVAGPEFQGRAAATRPRSSTTRVRPRRRSALWAACLALGLAAGILVWMVMR